MKIAVCVVWYNPIEDYVKNIRSYFFQGCPFSKLYIIDNSQIDNKNLVPEDESIVYIANLKNQGIAKALNQGCKLAFEDGNDYLMTMDQDSFFTDDNLNEYLRIVTENQELADSFAPNTIQDVDSIPVLLQIKNKLIKQHKETIFVDRCITSGNIISLHIWEQIGKFCEELFIDEVDFEFCYRLKKYKGDRILKCQNVYLTHSIGNPKKTVIPEFDSHSGIRIYYLIRNKLYIKKWYPEMYKKFKYRRLFICLYLKYFFNKTDFEYVKKAINDFNNGILGKMNEN